MRIVDIPTGRPYQALIGRGLLDSLGEKTAQVHAPCRAVIVTDSTVAPLYLNRALDSLKRAGFEADSFVMPAGEENKNAETYIAVQRFLIRSGLTRSDLLVALGGGVVGDMAGFAAATYQRGIPFVQVPTTLLCAVDASVGGKTAIDLPEGKNMVGAFHQPLLVVCDTETFGTLPEERWHDGAGEMLKHGVLRDGEMFGLLAQGCWRDRTDELVERNIGIKRSFVVGDEKDRGKRQLLNFGHTIGHAAELLSRFSLPHGHAVAAGMVAETRAARKMGLTKLDEAIILEGVRANGLPADTGFSADDVLAAVLRDKKRLGGAIGVCVPLELGEAELYMLPVSQLRDYVEMGLNP